MNYMAERVAHWGTSIFAEMTALAVAHNAVNLGQGFPDFAAPQFIKEAAVTAVSSKPEFYEALTRFYTQKRNYLLDALSSAGLKPIVPQGTYFIMVDISELGFENDVAFCRYLTQEIGVAAIPPSAFYHNPADGAGLARFAFCKEDKTLDEAARRLQRITWG